MAEHSGGLQGPRAHRQTPVTTSNDLSHDCPKVNNPAGNSSLKVRRSRFGRQGSWPK